MIPHGKTPPRIRCASSGLVPWPRIQVITALEPTTKERLHTIFGQMHAWFADALVTLFLLHILGALKHQWVDREPELQRMLPRSGRDS
jgi:cytochrome b561